LDALDCEVEQFAGGWIDPMRVLKNDYHWLPARQILEPADQRHQGQLLFALRAEVWQLVSLRNRQ